MRLEVNRFCPYLIASISGPANAEGVAWQQRG
jgi:hypothetical protein